MDAVKREIFASNEARETINGEISSLQDELARATSLKTNISSNINYRKAKKEIDEVENELETIDIEQAAKSRREFNKRYTTMMEKETQAQNSVSLAAESSARADPAGSVAKCQWCLEPDEVESQANGRYSQIRLLKGRQGVQGAAHQDQSQRVCKQRP